MRRVFAFAFALLVALAATVALAPGDPVAPRPATADELNRAVVVVDLGNGEVRSACVRFRQQSITGIDLLRAARMDPVVQTYAGQGGAVCKLCGVGCNAGSNCLTCQSPRYWQYWRSNGGTGAYTYSRAGAGSTEVTDGDVEGWSWSESEDPPPFLTVAEACSGPNVYDYQAASSSSSAAAPSTSTSAPAPTSTTSRPATSTSTRPARSAVPTTSPVVVAAPRNSVAGAPSTTTALPPPTSTTAAPASELALRSTPRGSPDEAAEAGAPRSSPLGLVAFAAVLAAVLGWTARLRSVRRRTRSLET